jgi:hypothetical protein
MNMSIDNAIDTKSPIHLLLTDLAACFDSIPFIVIQLCMRAIGFPTEMQQLIIGLQTGQYRSVRVGGDLPDSVFFALWGGIPQGCGLSCILLTCITTIIIKFTDEITKNARGTTACICHHPRLNEFLNDPHSHSPHPPQPIPHKLNVNVHHIPLHAHASNALNV